MKKIFSILLFGLCLMFAISLFNSKREEAVERIKIETGVKSNLQIMRDFITSDLADLYLQRKALPTNQLLRDLSLKCIDEFGPFKYVSVLENGNLVDKWGNLIHLEMANTGMNEKPPKIRIWSNGRNGINENGAGDDLLVE